MPKIQVFVNTKGDTQIMVDGVKGGSCTDLTAKLEELLWGEVTDEGRTFTEEFDETPELEQDQDIHNTAG